MSQGKVEIKLTFGLEAGVCKVVGLWSCLADLQLGLLEVLLLFLLLLCAGAHGVSRCRGFPSFFFLCGSLRMSALAAWVCCGDTRGPGERTIFVRAELAANAARRPRPRQARRRGPAAPAFCQQSPQPELPVTAHSSSRQSPAMSQVVVRSAICPVSPCNSR